MKRSIFLALLLSTPAHAQDSVRVFISVDMEGIGGIAHGEMTSAEAGEYERGRALMVGEVNAAIAGARESSRRSI